MKGELYTYHQMKGFSSQLKTKVVSNAFANKQALHGGLELDAQYSTLRRIERETGKEIHPWFAF